MGIIAQEDLQAVKNLVKKCENCGKETKRLVLSKGRYGRRLCADCLFRVPTWSGKQCQAGVIGLSAEPDSKIIRLFKCFGCGEMRAAAKMSVCPLICRECFMRSGQMTEDSRNVFTDSAVERTRRSLGRRT